MKPQKIKRDPQLDLFKIELNRIINFEHPLAKLAKQMDWNAFDQEFETHFTDEGRPAIPTRLMVSLHYLKYSHNLSDEETVACWVENPYWQYLSGRQHFEHEMPIDPSSMTRWRKRIGVDGAELLLSQTIQTAMEQKYLKPMQCQRVSVDTTVQTKIFDSRRMHDCMIACVSALSRQLKMKISNYDKVIRAWANRFYAASRIMRMPNKADGPPKKPNGSRHCWAGWLGMLSEKPMNHQEF